MAFWGGHGANFEEFLHKYQIQNRGIKPQLDCENAADHGSAEQVQLFRHGTHSVQCFKDAPIFAPDALGPICGCRPLRTCGAGRWLRRCGTGSSTLPAAPLLARTSAAAAAATTCCGGRRNGRHPNLVVVAAAVARVVWLPLVVGLLLRAALLLELADDRARGIPSATSAPVRAPRAPSPDSAYAAACAELGEAIDAGRAELALVTTRDTYMLRCTGSGHAILQR